MTNRTTLDDAARVLNHARAAGFEIKSEGNELCGFTIHSISFPANPYTRCHTHVIVLVRHPGQGRRASARITTRRPGGTARGAWDAYYAIRETRKDLYSWAKHIAAISVSLESANL